MESLLLADWLGLGGGGVGVAAVFYAVFTKINALQIEVDTARKEAATAIEVAAQHGEEMNMLRDAIDRLREQIVTDTTQMRAEIHTLQTGLQESVSRLQDHINLIRNANMQ